MAVEAPTRTAITNSTKMRSGLHKRPQIGESVIETFLFFCGALSILTTIGIVFVLVEESWLFFGSNEVDLWEFFGQGRPPQVLVVLHQT